MNKTYIYLSVLMVAIASLVLFVPEQKNKTELTPDELLTDLQDETRFVTVDEVAKSIVNANPAYQLIDVRTVEEYNQYHLNGAINIPLDSILNESALEVLDQQIKKNVFYSTGTVYANQAWIICRRLGIDNIYVMKGGLNSWFANIIKDQQPAMFTDNLEEKQFLFHKAASMYFGGGSKVTSSSETSDKPKSAAPVKKKKSAGGGC